MIFFHAQHFVLSVCPAMYSQKGNHISYIYIIHKKAFADNEPDGSFRQHDASFSEGAWVTPLVVVVAVEVVAVVLMLVP